NQGHKLNLIFLFQSIIFLLMGVVFAWFGWGLMAQAMGGLIANFVGVMLLKYYSGVKIHYTKNKSHRFSELISRHQKPQLLNEIATKISLQCDQIIIAVFTGPLMVTKVFLGQRVAT